MNNRYPIRFLEPEGRLQDDGGLVSGGSGGNGGMNVEL
jgi:hypothetical protein